MFFVKKEKKIATSPAAPRNDNEGVLFKKIATSSAAPRNNRFKQSGRSMIEMLGVLAIIGILSVGGIVGYTKAVEKHKIDQTMQQMNIIVNNMRTAFLARGGDHPYADFGPDKGMNSAGMRAAIALGVFPEEMLGQVISVPYYTSRISTTQARGGGSGYGSGSGSVVTKNVIDWILDGSIDIPVVQNAYRGEVYIISEDDGETFSVIFEGLPKDVAVALGSANWGAGDASALQEVYLLGGEEKEDEGE